MMTSEVNNTGVFTKVTTSTELPLLWLGEPYFYAIHILAICILVTSVLASFGTIMFLFISERTCKRRWFYNWTVGERLVVYLAIFDLTSSISHGMDHTYILMTHRRHPEVLCSIVGALVLQFIMGQGLVVIFTSISACCLVIWQKKIKLGRWDWRLLALVLSIPAIFSCFGVGFEFIGFTGAWCMFDMGTHLGIVMNNIKGWVQTLIFVTNAVCYGAIWLKMKTSGPPTESNVDTARKRKYHRSARVMLLFVLAYLGQWFPHIVYDVWSLWERPGKVLTAIIVIMCNWGGVFNAVAYTIMRRKYL